MSDLQSCLGTKYLQQTQFEREKIMSMPRLHISPAAPYKTYSDATTFLLPDAERPATDLWDVLASRRSRRRYADQALSLEVVSALLWASLGISNRSGGVSLRTFPSAGALYPIETYLQVRRIEGLEPGLYHLNVRDWCLETLQKGQFGAHLAKACLDQRFMAQAAFNVCWSAVLRRNMAKYGHRGMRYIFMEAGHVCQNLLLAAEGLELSACPVGAYFDQEVNNLFDLDGEEESLIYFASVGSRGGQG